MPEFSMIAAPQIAQRAHLRRGKGPYFLLTVDAEEDFDWSAPFRREGWRLHSLARIAGFQTFCEEHGVHPIWLIDYPVATAQATIDALAPALATQNAEIGLQLHPWVNPPFDEALDTLHGTTPNSFAGNLPCDLERAKLHVLHEAVVKNFGQAPQIYRAGRYGVGANTARLLSELGLSIDTSVRAAFDYSAIAGPDFTAMPSYPWWVGEIDSSAQKPLLELPLTTVFTGWLRQHSAKIWPNIAYKPWQRASMARSGLIERIPLTPEGVTINEARRAIDIALASGLEVLVFSFHSPSLLPGCTPYVRSESDVKNLYGWWRAIFAHLERRSVKNIASCGLLDSLDTSHMSNTKLLRC